MPAKEKELTPAQQYRQMLNSLSDHERLIMRLENRWKKSIDKWVRASVKCQSVYRMHLAQRVAMGLRGKARVLKMKLNLIAKAQDHFRWKKWDECMKTAQEVLALEGVVFVSPLVLDGATNSFRNLFCRQRLCVISHVSQFLHVT